MKRHALSLAAVIVASYALAACGRSELEVPEGVPDAHVVVDVPIDRPDTPSPVDRPDVPDTEPACTSDRQCNDGLSCNGDERCVEGRCAPGFGVACNDNVVCTVDQCVEGRGCVFRPDDSRCFAPAFCDPMRDCTPVECVGDRDCDNGDPCDGAEACRAGRCARGSPLTCDDGVACTVDQCLPGRGCLNRVDDTRCNDGLFCNGVERCDARRGCFSEMPVLCDDADPCTSDRCDEGRRTCITAPTDGDGDGFGPVSCAGGRDCNDADRTVNPGAPELCNDGRDNNCDGRADCADVACAGTPACGPCVPTGAEVCGDGRDNDCDRLIDCADSDCASAPVCVMCIPTGPEIDPMRCADGIDNDCNGVRDCADANCRFLPGCMMCVPDARIERCGDGRDNDCNGAADCADAACRDTDFCRVVNDTCASPTLLAVPGRVSGTTATARDDFTPTCAGMGSSDVVYVIRNPRRQTITIDTLGSSYDTALIVYRDACGVTPIACDDDGAGVGTASRVVLPSAEPGTYFIVVDGWNGASGAFQLNVNVGATEVCNNRVDDDGDGLVDCLDRADCATNPFCTMCVPMGPEACSDGRDNDCDGFIDCSDFECREVPACMMCMPTGPESDDATCSDGRDNDCNGRADCADPRCAMLPVCVAPPVNDTCRTPLRVGVPSTTRGSINGARNDYTPVLGAPGCAGGAGGDVVYVLVVGRDTVINIDTVGSTFDTVLYVRREPCERGAQLACNDDTGGTASRVTFSASPGIYYVFVDGFSEGSRGDFVLNISEVVGSEVCDNSRDDDGDGAIDCADAECAMFPACRCFPVPENNDRACSDRIDNDCDGQADCADAECAVTRACCRPTGAEADARTCSDGLDNDCDGLRDCADPGCAAQRMCCRPTMMREAGVAACTDGVDNDCDGVADCADSDCRPTTVPGGECCNGIDDNGNTLIDEFACACEADAQCAGVGSGGRFPSTACWNTTFRVCAPRCDLLGGNLFCSNFFAGTRCNTTTGECVR